MDERELRRLLEQLHNEIEKIEGPDTDGHIARLRELSAEVEHLLAPVAGGAQPGLLGRMEEAVGQLEGGHPALAALLAKLLEGLSNAGI